MDVVDQAGQHLDVDAGAAGGRQGDPPGDAAKARYEWRSPSAALLSLVLLEFGDFPMMRRMLRGLKQRAEQAAGVQSTGADKDAADAQQ
jgi:hypothetical protein